MSELGQKAKFRREQRGVRSYLTSGHPFCARSRQGRQGGGVDHVLMAVPVPSLPTMPWQDDG